MTSFLFTPRRGEAEGERKTSAARVISLLALAVASQLYAGGRDLAPQRLDAPIGNIGPNLQTVTNGSTILWLWTIENFPAGKHVYAAITETSGAIRVPAMPVWPYIDQYAYTAAAGPEGYLLYRGDFLQREQRTLGDAGQLGPVIPVPAMPANTTALAPPPAEVTQMPVSQEGPKIASDGSGFLAVWTERGGTTQAIIAQRLDANGIPSGTPLELTRTNGILGEHGVAFGGGQYLVIWQNGSQIFGMRIGASGAAIDSLPFVVATIIEGSRFGIASDGNDFLVTWGYRSIISGAIVTADARASAARPLITSADQLNRSEPSVVFDGSRYVVACVADWPSIFPCIDCSYDTRIEAVRVGRDGVPLDAEPSVAARPEGHNASSLSIASSGQGDAMITFVSYGLLIAAALHDDAALHADAPVVLFRWFDLVVPSVTWSNGAYLVAFRYTSAFYDFDGHGEWYLGAMRIDRDGSHNVFATITGPPREMDVETPGLAATADGNVTMAVSEGRAPGLNPRAVGYSLLDLHQSTAPAAPAVTWQQSTDGRNLVVSWPHVATDERGFYLTLSKRHSQQTQQWIPAGALGTTLPWQADLVSFKLLVWTEGGFASRDVSTVQPRTRAVRN
jgi:hypothetical protein